MSKIPRLLGLSVSLALIQATPAWALTYFVSPSGTSSARGTERSAPTSTGAALGRVSPGDTVIFLDGTYSRPMYLTRSGKPGAPITLQADDGAVPVFRGPGTPRSGNGLAASADVSNYVIDGLWFENWGTGGIGLAWDHKVSNIVIRHCVADLNLKNGFAPYYATNVLIENNIASRNGWGPDSWSSNFSIFGVKGSSNIVRGNVSFEAVDTSSHRSDGNGFILDLTLDRGSALFENNIGFLNGGSCISVTDSGGARLVGNTCYANAQYGAPYQNELNIGNTCRKGVIAKMPVDGKPYTFKNLILRNNAVVPAVPGKSGLNVFNSKPCGGGTRYSNEGGFMQPVLARRVFASPGSADFHPVPGSALVDRVAHGNTAATDIGFDPSCIKRETDLSKKKFAFWLFAPNLDYMKRIGGIRHCFHPIPRPQGKAQEIGAYELPAARAPR